jgi:hypothetical protein
MNRVAAGTREGGERLRRDVGELRHDVVVAHGPRQGLMRKKTLDFMGLEHGRPFKTTGEAPPHTYAT